MSYLEFDQKQLINLEYSLRRELVRANGGGAMGCTTIVNCNTRRYHGLLTCRVAELGGGQHVLLNIVDPTIVLQGQEFHLGIHKHAGGVYAPRGHKYLERCEVGAVPSLVYNVGGARLLVEQALDDTADRALLCYTLLDSPRPIALRLKPLLSFRGAHDLSRANMQADVRPQTIANGIRMRLYDRFPHLHLQTSREADFVHMPDWHYNVEYQEEQERGYDYAEDLFTPGYFEARLSKGGALVLAAGTEEMDPGRIRRHFTRVKAGRLAKRNYSECLANAAGQFVERRGGQTFVKAGFPWFDARARDTMVAAPGLCAALGQAGTLAEILDTAAAQLAGGLLPATLDGAGQGATRSADTSLWFAHAVEQGRALFPGFDAQRYWPAIRQIMESLRAGAAYKTGMTDQCLLYTGDDEPQSWMDAKAGRAAVTPRRGYTVEANALFYNAAMFALELAAEAGDDDFARQWRHIPGVTRDAFQRRFWIAQGGYLADHCTTHRQDPSVRPNQIIACALPHSPLDDDQKRAVIARVRHELLTPKGLRTLSPKNPAYRPQYAGGHKEREMSYHQGTIHPWLLEFYAKALARVEGEAALGELTQLLFGLEAEMASHGVGTLSEMYDADPPHTPRGAVSMAWSVAAALQIKRMVDTMSAGRRKTTQTPRD